MSRYRPIVAVCTLSLALLCGCTTSSSLVKPIPRLSVISPELENLTDEKIEIYLTADVRPIMPTVLAVARVAPMTVYQSREESGSRLYLQQISGDEAAGWRSLTDLHSDAGAPVVEQVQFVSRMIAGGEPTLKGLRDAAAMLHAPLLFVYMQEDNSREGFNEAAIAYWTIVGLFLVPGNFVGCHSACEGVLIDTRTGFILATADGDARREEDVFVGAVEIARERTQRTSKEEAIQTLQANFRQTIEALAETRGVRSAP